MCGVVERLVVEQQQRVLVEPAADLGEPVGRRDVAQVDAHDLDAEPGVQRSCDPGRDRFGTIVPTRISDRRAVGEARTYTPRMTDTIDRDAIRARHRG